MINSSLSVLLTDLYQLTMLQGYYAQQMNDMAVFEFFSRKLPPHRNFLLSAGLEQLLDYLENLQFKPEETEWLRTTGRFSSEFIDYLEQLTFTGDVYAMPEGTVFFPDEPVVRVVAPLPEAQLVESRLINIMQFQTLIASKAARCVLTAPDKLLIDFGLRRAHGAEAGLLAARASYIAGFAGTATVLAGREFGIPVFGTMAHSFVQVHEKEEQAFMNFAEAQPDNVVLLIDTYDTENAASKVVSIAPLLKQKGITIKGVRIDSGDLADHAFNVRKILDEGQLPEVTIFSSSSIDEYVLHELLYVKQAPIDGFGIGTNMDTSADAPYLDCAYKLQEYAGQPRRKFSEGKTTWPGRKQVYRYYDDQGKMSHDVLALETDSISDAEPMLQQVMTNGRRVGAPEPLSAVRERTTRQLASLPTALQQIDKMENYPVTISPSLLSLAEQVNTWITKHNR